MLFWTDWQLELAVQDSPRFRKALLVVIGCTLVTLLILTFFEPLLLSILLLVLLQVWCCWRFYWSKQASHGLSSLLCKQGQWSVELNTGQSMHGLQLKRYFVGTFFILLVFQSEQVQLKGKGLPIWHRLLNLSVLPFTGRHRFIIFPEQVGEASFRQLLVLLRYRATCLQSE